MSTCSVLSAFADLHLIQAVIQTDYVLLILTPRSSTASCPLCSVPSTRIQSRYCRSLADLPIQGKPVRAQLQVRRFFCDSTVCPRKVFCERLPNFAPAYARFSVRLAEALRATGLALGGEAGSRLAVKLAMAASPDTLLRLVRQTPLPEFTTPRVLGVDDWAVRKGQHYGTILVDLERRIPVDLLPDRQATTFAAWLQVHPGVEIIARDRSGAYADGARQGAPAATQVADRWHLLANLTETLSRLLAAKHSLLRRAAEAATPSLLPAPPSADASPVAKPKPMTPERERRLARYQEVRELYRQGASIQAIARHLRMHRRTVRLFLRSESLPERAPAPKRGRSLGPHLPYLKQRWAEGCHSAAALWREVAAQGYPGCQSSVRHYLARWRSELPKPLRRTRGRPPRPRPKLATMCSPRKVAWLLYREDELRPEEEQFLDRLSEIWPEAKLVRELAREFKDLVSRRQLQGFAQSLERDKEAVLGALSQEWSTGQVEGQINRLKLVKRQMYGRAKLDLLRQRVLNAA